MALYNKVNKIWDKHDLSFDQLEYDSKTFCERFGDILSTDRYIELESMLVTLTNSIAKDGRKNLIDYIVKNRDSYKGY